MNSQTSSPQQKSRLWKIVLVTSLALNIAIIGAVGGAFLRFGKEGPRGKPKFDAVAGSVYIRALTREDRRKLGQDMREKHASQSSVRDSLDARFEDALRLLRGDSFDVAAFNDVMEQHSAISNSRQSDARTMLINHISAMSLEERSAYADRLEAALNRRGRHKNKKE